MPLTTGVRLGVYEIKGVLGAGGMGEVYRARDTKLNRDVAIKTLPPAFAADRDRVSRFEREAQVLAALNHPRIAQIYGVIESPAALVMELVEGEDLSARISRGAIPLGEALSLGSQIAEALECAHEKGIIHRDLKPANIKVGEDGAVKVLDFGLAKALAGDVDAGGVSVEGPFANGPDNSPTMTSPAMTQLGMILGTAAYMAPEQAKGKEVDRRADIWAFGAVLFEMLTGQRAFAGEDVTDVIASIMRAEPDWSGLPAETPPGIRRLLRRCLEKDRAKRLDSMAVARYEIQESLAAPDPQHTAAVLPPRRSSVLPLVATAVVCAAAAAGLTWFAVRPDVAASPVMRVHVTPAPPDGLSLDTFVGDVDVSPDGTAIAYTGRRGTGAPQIFVRRLDQAEGVALPGTTDGRGPVFSADGQWISFQAGTEVKRVTQTGGAPQVVCTSCGAGYRGGSWLADGSFVFSASGGASGLQILRRDAAPAALTRVDQKANERAHVYPRALPGGRGVLFAVNTAGGSHVAVLDLRSNTTKVLVGVGSSPHYSSSGHLLYAASGTLYAMPFDLDRLETTGVAVPVIGGLVTKSSGGASYAVAGNGSLAYVAGDQVTSTYSVTIRGRQGAEELLPLSPGGYIMGRFSPDGARAVLDSRAFELDLWIWDFGQKNQRRLTFAPTSDQYPAWTPDGKQIVYAGSDNGLRGIFRRSADGSGAAERLASLDASMMPTSFTPDGQTLVAHVSTGTATLAPGLYTISMTGDHTPRLLGGTAAGPLNAQLSTDGRWIAYQTMESGRAEVIVHPFPNLAGGRWQVSGSGGTQPLFSPRGDELFYRDAERRLIAVPLRLGPQFSHGNPTVVLENVFSPGPGRPYDVSPDGQRFMLVHESRVETTGGRPPQLNLILNWFEELTRLVPAGKGGQAP